MAMSYGNVYVAQVAMGANDAQTLQAFLEAEAYDGPSLIIAYSHCIAHGIDMRMGLTQQKLATESGHWPLYRYHPALAAQGKNPFQLDCQSAVSPAARSISTRRRATGCCCRAIRRWPRLLALAEAGRRGALALLRAARRHKPPVNGRRRSTARLKEDDHAGPDDNYLGLSLCASDRALGFAAFSTTLAGIRRLEDAGAPAVVLHSLFEEQIDGESRQASITT